MRYLAAYQFIFKERRNMIEVTRPAASEDKINHRESFELCYLRHQYFRRVKYNPTEEEMHPFMKIVENLSKNTFFVYVNLFKAVGMYHDDVLNIGRVHLVSFLGLYALSRMEEKKKEFIDKFERYEFRTPDEKDFEQKDKANFTMFFKQRMEDLVRVCRQKVRNINGHPSEEFVVFCGKDSPPKQPRRLLKNHEELGYKRLDFSIFKSFRRKAKVNGDATMFVFDNTWYVAIAIEQKKLSLDDLVGSDSNPYNNEHNMQPDAMYEEKESDRLGALFSGKPRSKKVKILRKFIAKNRLNRQYSEEILTARRLLRRLGE